MIKVLSSLLSKLLDRYMIMTISSLGTGEPEGQVGKYIIQAINKIRNLSGKCIPTVRQRR